METCGTAEALQMVEVAPDFTPEEKKDVDFVKLHDEGTKTLNLWALKGIPYFRGSA